MKALEGQSARESYDPTYYDCLSSVEDKHFWYRGRNRVLAALVRSVVAEWPPGFRVLEVGCGTGHVLPVLQNVCRRGTVVGLDLYLEGLDKGRRRGAFRLVQGNLDLPPFGDSFDLLCMFDVLEHFSDDHGVLQVMRSLLTRHGRVLLTVPAHPSLWSYFDEAAHHQRRYEPEALHHALVRAGYRVEYLSPYMSVLAPLLWVRRRLFGRRPLPSGSEARGVRDRVEAELRLVPGVNRVLTGLLAAEARLVGARRRLPFGASLVAVARRTDD